MQNEKVLIELSEYSGVQARKALKHLLTPLTTISDCLLMVRTDQDIDEVTDENKEIICRIDCLSARQARIALMCVYESLSLDESLNMAECYGGPHTPPSRNLDDQSIVDAQYLNDKICPICDIEKEEE